ncbi:rhomboid family intramembrane serine protease [bacterium]|jgi:membrane associated rhomboid family serine protease|nr:rhomboid family intramembrane serine protease [bacterium]MBT6019103.1 rhomboid family intramembrane serine protease [bacterium]MBT6777292.1 rhomboid family intramembrane serine protease [bacterium]
MKYRLHFNPGETAYKPQIFTEAIKILISINFVIYVLQSLAGKEDIFFRLFGLVPNVFISELMLWQPFTYMFFHAPYYSSVGISHILLNMLGLWVFGRELEQAWGKSKFLKYYFLTGIGSGLITYLFQINSDNPVIGASGAVYGILLAYGISFPNRMLYIWGLIPVRSIWLVVIMGSIAFFGLLGRADGISHVTHISGMLIGYIFLKKKWQLADIIFAMRKKTVEFQVQRKEDRALKKKYINRDIDIILEKIKEVGFSGLSNEEQSKLYEASKNLSKSGQRD